MNNPWLERKEVRTDEIASQIVAAYQARVRAEVQHFLGIRRATAAVDEMLRQEQADSDALLADLDRIQEDIQQLLKELKSSWYWNEL